MEGLRRKGLSEMTFTRWTHLGVMTAVAVAATAMPKQVVAQTAPHQSGTVKTATADSLTLTTAGGQNYTVALPATAKSLVVAPGGTAQSATPGAASDVAVGDRAIVIGVASDTGTSLTASKMYLMKSAAIAQSHAASDAAWAQGSGGIVKSVDATKVVISSGMKTITVVTTPSTVVRHYSGDSVSFADAKVCALSDVKVGDQLRVRGSKAMDGLTITADEMVAGTFHNYSGLLTAVDGTAGTVTLKDLASKKSVTVAISPNSDVRRIAPAMAQMVAARMKAPAGAAATAAGGAEAPGGGARGAGRGGADLSQMLSRLPKETVAGLKAGEAVMIVATSASSDPTKSSAVTLLVGVDPILTASPTGEMTLSPWSVGGGAPSEGGGGM
jgi:hypothetical protein